MCSALLCPLLHYHTAPAKMFAATFTLYIVLSTRADFGGIHLLCSHTITPCTIHHTYERYPEYGQKNDLKWVRRSDGLRGDKKPLQIHFMFMAVFSHATDSEFMEYRMIGQIFDDHQRIKRANWRNVRMHFGLSPGGPSGVLSSFFFRFSFHLLLLNKVFVFRDFQQRKKKPAPSPFN